MYYDSLEEVIAYYHFIAEEKMNSPVRSIRDEAYKDALCTISSCLETSLEYAVSVAWEKVLELRTWLSEHHRGGMRYERRYWTESVYWELLVAYIVFTHDWSFAE